MMGGTLTPLMILNTKNLHFRELREMCLVENISYDNITTISMAPLLSPLLLY